MKTNKFTVYAMVILLIISITVGCQTSEQTANNPTEAKQKTVYLRLATSGTTGVYYALGNGMAVLWNERIPGLKVSAQSTAGSRQNIDLLHGEAEMAILQAGIALQAAKGLGPWEGKPQDNLRVITYTHPNPVCFFTRADSNIYSIEDMKGKKFSPGPMGGGTEQNSREILDIYGINYHERKDVDPVFVSDKEQAEMIKNKQIDVAQIAGMDPHPAILSAAAGTPIRVLPIEDNIAEKVNAKMPWYYQYTIPAGTYPGQDEDVKTLSMGNLLAVNADIDEEVVYQITKILFEETEQLFNVHAAAKHIKLESAFDGTGDLPIHPGALRYYKEKGIIK